MCIGPVELAAAGVAVALFNQASRITIFPLVSITTSFVAEEDTIQKMNIAKAAESDKANNLLQDLENGTSKQNNNLKALEETVAGKDKIPPEDVEKSATENKDTSVGDGNSFCLLLLLHFWLFGNSGLRNI